MRLFERFKKKNSVSKTSSVPDGNDEKEYMLDGIERLSKTVVKEVMIPRIDVDFLSIDTHDSELVEKIAESGHSRFPVYDQSIDNVIGVLYVKDIIKLLAKKEKIELKNIIRKPFFVPESKHIDSLLMEFKRKHIHIAIAVDEYGGISGIVCMEDIIEEIVGDIQDEFDSEEPDIKCIADGIWICDARFDLDDLAKNIKTKLPSDAFETLGGFVLDLFGKIPMQGEKIVWNDYDFIIKNMDGHKVNSVKIVSHKYKNFESQQESSDGSLYASKE